MSSATNMTYKDHSSIEESDVPSFDTNRFPSILHFVIQSAETENQTDVISWKPHGRCFVVHDRKKFVKDFLPNWFRQNGYGSFQRQLNLYSFKRITKGPDQGGYYHELFLRGKPFLAKFIYRTTKKCQRPRKPAIPECEPKFYEMNFLPSSFEMQQVQRKNIPTNEQSGQKQLSIDVKTRSVTPSNLQSLLPLLYGSSNAGSQSNEAFMLQESNRFSLLITNDASGTLTTRHQGEPQQQQQIISPEFFSVDCGPFRHSKMESIGKGC